jgi:hypothetical protein
MGNIILEELVASFFTSGYTEDVIINDIKEDASILDLLISSQFHLIHDTSQLQCWLTIPKAVSTVMCS